MAQQTETDLPKMIHDLQKEREALIAELHQQHAKIQELEKSMTMPQVGLSPIKKKPMTERGIDTTVKLNEIEEVGDNRVALFHDPAGNTTLIKEVGTVPIPTGTVITGLQTQIQQMLPQYDLARLQPADLHMKVKVDEHGFANSMLVQKAVYAWCSLFGVTDDIDRPTVISAVCWFFATNSTSPLVPGELELSVMLGDTLRIRPLSQIRHITTQITAESSMRRIMRGFADFTRSMLERNPTLVPKIHRKLLLAERFRTVAYDFADGCRNPPLTSAENVIFQRVKAYLLSGKELLEQKTEVPIVQAPGLETIKSDIKE